MSSRLLPLARPCPIGMVAITTLVATYSTGARTTLKTGKLAPRVCAHDVAPPYHRLADFPRCPFVWYRGAAAAPNHADDALLGSKNSDPNDGNRRQYNPLHQDRERTIPRPVAHAENPTRYI